MFGNKIDNGSLMVEQWLINGEAMVNDSVSP